jgi:hypothetical protein
MLRAAASRLRPLVLALAIAAAAVAAGSCGSSDGDASLSRPAARTLRADLDQVEQDVRSGDCGAAQQHAESLLADSGALPGGTPARLRDALKASAARLESLVQARCQQADTSQTPPVEPQVEEDQDRMGQKKQKGQKKAAGQKDKTTKQQEAKRKKSQEVSPDQGNGTQTTPDQQQGDGGRPPAGGDPSGGSSL